MQERERSIKVLLADDEERFLKTTAAALEKRGMQVVAVASGPEAVKEIKENVFDVVILDVRMPIMDGNETLQEIKAINPDIPTIMLTGYGFPVWEHKGYLGPVFYLAKPFELETLFEMINRVHAHRRRPVDV